MKQLIGIFMLFPVCLMAQRNGIQFEHGLNWHQIMAKAKAENKYIFVDCYASWCGPCKAMDNKIYPNDTVGLYANDKFISVKVQMDTSNHDIDEIRKWYADAQKMQQEYMITAYPSFLFFSPEGKLIHKSIGFKTQKDFIALLTAAQDTTQQYYLLLSKYKAGDRNKTLLQNLVSEALKVNDKTEAFAAADDYLSSLDDPFTKEHLILINQLIGSSSGSAFQLFLDNPERINEVLGDKNRAQAVVMGVLSYEMYMQFIDKMNMPINWLDIKESLNKKAPALADQILLKMKIEDAGRRGQWDENADMQLTYYDKYSSKITGYDLWAMNNNLWGIFQVCKNKKILIRAAKWSKFTISRGDTIIEDPTNIDTYANLLYKAGKIQEGISWEQKALEIASRDKDPSAKGPYVEVLDKMRNGFPTWPVK